MTAEEVIAAAAAARKAAAEMLGIPLPPTTPVVYETCSILIKLGGSWWVMVIGKEEKPDLHHTITMMPFEHYFGRTNEMLTALVKLEGATKTSLMLGVDILDEEDKTGEPSPTLN